MAEKKREKNHELYLVFVDPTKDFDAVNREALWKDLKMLGIPNRMLNVTISFHGAMKAAVVFNEEFSNFFDVTNDTKQRCAMSPVFFALFFSVILKYAFGHMDNGIKFQFRTSGDLFNFQRFKAKKLL